MSTTKVDLVLRALDRIKSTIEEEQSRLGISPQPILQFFGPPIPPYMALVQAAWDRSRINRLLEIVPEPENYTRESFHREPAEARPAGKKQGKRVA
jgi:hypothetical protein